MEKYKTPFYEKTVLFTLKRKNIFLIKYQFIGFDFLFIDSTLIM